MSNDIIGINNQTDFQEEQVDLLFETSGKYIGMGSALLVDEDNIRFKTSLSDIQSINISKYITIFIELLLFSGYLAIILVAILTRNSAGVFLAVIFLPIFIIFPIKIVWVLKSLKDKFDLTYKVKNIEVDGDYKIYNLENDKILVRVQRDKDPKNLIKKYSNTFSKGFWFFINGYTSIKNGCFYWAGASFGLSAFLNNRVSDNIHSILFYLVVIGFPEILTFLAQPIEKGKALIIDFCLREYIFNSFNNLKKTLSSFDLWLAPNQSSESTVKLNNSLYLEKTNGIALKGSVEIDKDLNVTFKQESQFSKSEKLVFFTIKSVLFILIAIQIYFLQDFQTFKWNSPVHIAGFIVWLIIMAFALPVPFFYLFLSKKDKTFKGKAAWNIRDYIYIDDCYSQCLITSDKKVDYKAVFKCLPKDYLFYLTFPTSIIIELSTIFCIGLANFILIKIIQSGYTLDDFMDIIGLQIYLVFAIIIIMWLISNLTNVNKKSIETILTKFYSSE